MVTNNYLYYILIIKAYAVYDIKYYTFINPIGMSIVYNSWNAISSDLYSLIGVFREVVQVIIQNVGQGMSTPEYAELKTLIACDVCYGSGSR